MKVYKPRQLTFWQLLFMSPHRQHELSQAIAKRKYLREMRKAIRKLPAHLEDEVMIMQQSIRIIEIQRKTMNL